MAIDYTKSGPQLLTDLINLNNGTFFVPANLSFSAPTSYSNEAEPEKNTSVVVTGNSSTRFKGPKPVYYRRLDLDIQINERPRDFTIKASGVINWPLLLTQVNARYNLGLTASDVVFADAEPLTGETDVALTAAAGSLTYVGAGQLSLTPEADDDTIIEPVETATAPVAEQFQTSGGTLLTGTGNPSGGLILSTNGEVQIGGAIRKYRSTAILPQSDPGHYDVVLAAGEDWVFPIVYGLVDDRNADRLSDLYDLTLTITSVEEESHLDFTLEWNATTGRYEFADSAHSLRITDGTTNANGTAYQDIQRLTFYKQALGLTSVTASGVPTGTFTFQYRAVRRLGDVNPVVAEFSVTVTGQ
jgi:hypothetical protein